MTIDDTAQSTAVELTIAAGIAHGLLEFAVSKGASRKTLMERSGIESRELENQDNRISLTKYRDLMRAGQELCHDPALGLHYGETVEMDKISIVGLVGLASETVADGFAQINRYSRLALEVPTPGMDRFILQRVKGRLWMVDTSHYPDGFYELTESMFARMVCTSQRMYGERDPVKAVYFTHAAPPYRAEYGRVFQRPVAFQSEHNAIQIDETIMTWRNPNASRYAFGVLSAHAEELLKRLEQSKSMKGRVESLLMPILHTGNANLVTVAAKLGVSPRTLSRKLKNEGVTFEKVLDELRHTMALNYFRGKKVSVNETAYLVGFSEPAAFSRAFKRWTGINPSQYVLRSA